MKILSLFGVNLKIDFFAVLIFFIILYAGFVKQAAVMLSIIFIHELAHVIVAVLFGLKVEEIELLPIGATAKIANMQDLLPKQEILISLAGPAINFIMIIFIMFFDKVGYILRFFYYGNLAFAVFNLLPALPLDGGRILRAILHWFMGYKKATKILIIITRIIATGLFGLGLYIIIKGEKNILFLLVSIFLLISSNKESSILSYISIKNTLMRHSGHLSTKRLKVKHIIVTKDTKVKDIIDDFKPYNYYIILLMDDKGKIIAWLDEYRLIEGIMEYGINVTVGKLP